MPKSTKDAFNDTTDAASLLVKAEIERFKLKLTKTLTKWVTHLVTGFVLMLMFVLLLIFMGMAAGMALQAFMSASLAFACVGGFYALIAIAIYIFRMQIIGDKVLQSILKEIFDES
jgi:uncharacterized membrane protein